MKIVRATTAIEDVDDFLDWIRTIGEETGATIQCFDARYVAGERHLRRATTLAERAIDRGQAVANDPAVEILLYAAGRRQINRALEMGVSTGSHEVVAVVTGGDEASAADRFEAVCAESAVDGTEIEGRTDGDPETLKSFFDISDAELAVVDVDLEAVVLERVALLEVEK